MFTHRADARRSWLLALVLVGACAHGRPPRAGEERLAKIDVEGNRALSDKTLKTGLALRRVQKRGGGFDPYLVQLDAERIRGEYLRKGFLDIDVQSRVERVGDTSSVTYTVEEGQRAVTRTVITGLPSDVPVEEVRAQLPLEDGGPFSYETYDLAKPLLLGVVQNAGYAHAQLEAKVVADRANQTAIVVLAYTPGPKCTFGNIEVTGVKGELAQAVRERVAFQPGQQYSTQAITQTQRNLYGFGRFSTVRVTPEEGAREVVGVQIAVAESARREIKLGGGLGLEPTLYEVRGRAGYQIAGWPFPLDTVSFDLRPSYTYLRDGSANEPRLRALGKLERRDLFWTYTRSEVEAGYQYLTVEAYTSYGPLGRLGFETPLGSDRVKLRVGWSIQQLGFRQITPVFDEARRAQLGLDASERIAAFQQGLIVDLRNHPFQPTFGAYAELRIAEGTRFAGSEYDYLQVIPDLRGYLPLLAGAVLAGHARFGGIYGDIPISERFFGGGSVGHRGFSERRLSPSVTGEVDGDGRTIPYGGGGLIDTSLELRVPIATIRKLPLGAVAFLDGGDVTEKPEDLELGNLHWAVGAGLRLNTIVGPVRFDVGYRLNRLGEMEPSPGSRYAYHLTIGEAF